MTEQATAGEAIAYAVWVYEITGSIQDAVLAARAAGGHDVWALDILEAVAADLGGESQ